MHIVDIWREILLLGLYGPTHLPFTQQNEYIDTTNRDIWGKNRKEGDGTEETLWYIT
jgi:hypothetical protein